MYEPARHSCKNTPIKVWEMLESIVKCPTVQESGKVVLDRFPGSDQHQKLTTFKGSSLAHACQVWSTSVNTFVCFILQTDGHIDTHRWSHRPTCSAFIQRCAGNYSILLIFLASLIISIIIIPIRHYAHPITGTICLVLISFGEVRKPSVHVNWPQIAFVSDMFVVKQ